MGENSSIFTECLTKDILKKKLTDFFTESVTQLLLKIDNIIKKAIEHFSNIDEKVLQNIALNSWKKDYGFLGTKEQAETFVKQSKEMLTLVRKNVEINSKELQKILALSLFEYAKKLSNDISQCDHTEMEKMRKLRDEKLTAERKAILILQSLTSAER